MAYEPSTFINSEAASGLKHIMILNEIQQYDPQFVSVVIMHINIFRQVQSSSITEVQSSGITKIHVRAGALEAHRPRFEPHSSNPTSYSIQTSQSIRFHIRKLLEFSKSYLQQSLAYGRYSRYCGYQLKPPFMYCFS